LIVNLRKVTTISLQDKPCIPRHGLGSIPSASGFVSRR
jgi:hypothetical protein